MVVILCFCFREALMAEATLYPGSNDTETSEVTHCVCTFIHACSSVYIRRRVGEKSQSSSMLRFKGTVRLLLLLLLLPTKQAAVYIYLYIYTMYKYARWWLNIYLWGAYAMCDGDVTPYPQTYATSFMYACVQYVCYYNHIHARIPSTAPKSTLTNTTRKREKNLCV